MNLIYPPEFGKKLTCFQFQPVGQGLGANEGVFQFNDRFAFFTDQQNDVGLSSEIGIDRTANRQFRIGNRETTLLRFMPTSLKILN